MALRGTNGDDDIFGNRRANIILGFGGSDRLVGRAGNDILDGGRGNDLLQGGAGHDSLWGGKGRDFLEGGGGNDDFWFDTRHSFDVINDFSDGDAIVIDVEDGGFEGVRRADLFIERGARFDRLYVDGDYVAKVYGDLLHYRDIFLE